MDDLTVGTVVRRDSDGALGDGSVGIITSVSIKHNCYWVDIIEGKNRMEGWATDAWAKNWCTPINYNVKPQWEV